MNPSDGWGNTCSKYVFRTANKYSDFQMVYLYILDSILWILWIIHGYAIAAVCRDFIFTPLEGRVL